MLSYIQNEIQKIYSEIGSQNTNIPTFHHIVKTRKPKGRVGSDRCRAGTRRRWKNQRFRIINDSPPFQKITVAVLLPRLLTLTAANTLLKLQFVLTASALIFITLLIRASIFIFSGPLRYDRSLWRIYARLLAAGSRVTAGFAEAVVSLFTE